MDFLQFKDLIQQTGYLILTLIIAASIISSLQTISIRINKNEISSIRFFLTLFGYTVLYVIFTTFLIALLATLYNFLLDFVGQGPFF